MNILHGYPVYRADAGAVSPDPSHPEIRWRCSRNSNLGKFGLIAPTHFKSPTTSFSGEWSFRFGRLEPHGVAEYRGVPASFADILPIWATQPAKATLLHSHLERSATN